MRASGLGWEACCQYQLLWFMFGFKQNTYLISYRVEGRQVTMSMLSYLRQAGLLMALSAGELKQVRWDDWCTEGRVGDDACTA